MEGNEERRKMKVQQWLNLISKTPGYKRMRGTGNYNANSNFYVIKV